MCYFFPGNRVGEVYHHSICDYLLLHFWIAISALVFMVVFASENRDYPKLIIMLFSIVVLGPVGLLISVPYLYCWNGRRDSNAIHDSDFTSVVTENQQPPSPQIPQPRSHWTGLFNMFRFISCEYEQMQSKTHLDVSVFSKS